MPEDRKLRKTNARYFNRQNHTDINYIATNGRFKVGVYFINQE